MHRDPFLVHQVISLRYAIEGDYYSFKKGTHLKIQIAIFAVAAIFGFKYSINATEWLILLLISSVVLAAEAMNTAIEETCNLLHPEHHPLARLAKHCAAGSVLILSIGAMIIGLVIFIPKIFI